MQYITLEILQNALTENNKILLKGMDKSVKVIVNKIVDKKIDGLKSYITEGFDAMDKRFDFIETEIKEVKGQIRGINSRLDYHAEAYVKKPGY